MGKKCILFVDDLSMPLKEQYGAQPPIELLRLWIDHGHWFDFKTTIRFELIDIVSFIQWRTNRSGRSFVYEPLFSKIFFRNANLVLGESFPRKNIWRFCLTHKVFYALRIWAPLKIFIINLHIIKKSRSSFFWAEIFNFQKITFHFRTTIDLKSLVFINWVYLPFKKIIYILTIINLQQI